MQQSAERRWDDAQHWQEQLWAAAARQHQPSRLSRPAPGPALGEVWGAAPPPHPLQREGSGCNVLPIGSSVSTEVSYNFLNKAFDIPALQALPGAGWAWGGGGGVLPRPLPLSHLMRGDGDGAGAPTSPCCEPYTRGAGGCPGFNGHWGCVTSRFIVIVTVLPAASRLLPQGLCREAGVERGMLGAVQMVGGGPRSPAELPGTVLVDQGLVVAAELLHVRQLLLLGVEVELAAGARVGQCGGEGAAPPLGGLGQAPLTPPLPTLATHLSSLTQGSMRRSSSVQRCR